MGSYCACALSWPLPELSIRGADQKDHSSGNENAVSPFDYDDYTTLARAKNYHVTTILPCLAYAKYDQVTTFLAHFPSTDYH